MCGQGRDVRDQPEKMENGIVKSFVNEMKIGSRLIVTKDDQRKTLIDNRPSTSFF